MVQCNGCESHKKFSLFVVMNEDGEYGRAIRVGHDREVFRAFLKDLPPGSQIALETSGVTTGWWMRWSVPGIGRSWRSRGEAADGRTAQNR